MGCGASRRVADDAITKLPPKPSVRHPDTQQTSAGKVAPAQAEVKEKKISGSLKPPEPLSLQHALSRSQALTFPLSSFKADVLISFAESDLPLAHRLKASLEKEGVTVALIPDTANDEAKMEIITDSAVVIPILTPAYDKSDTCEMELNFANLIRKPLVPARFDVGPFTWSEVATTRMLYIDFHDHTNEDWDERIYELIRAVHEKITIHKNAPTAAAASSSGETLEDWLNPDTMRMEREMAELLKRKMAGTRDWIEDEVAKFLEDKSRSVFWLRGVDGSGKSVVAANIWKGLRDRDQLGAYYFFKRNLLRQSGPNVLIRNAAYQLSKRFPTIAAELLQIKPDYPDVCSTFVHLQNIFKALIEDRLDKVPVADQKTTVILVDGMDQCGHFNSKDRLDFLDTLSRWADVLPHYVKFIFTSKPQADIDEFFLGFNAFNLDIADENHEADLVLYAFTLLNKVKDRLKAQTEEEITELAIKLVSATGGLFSTLFTACENIRKSPSPELFLQELISHEL